MVFASELPHPVSKPIANDRSSEQWKMVNSLLLATIIRIGFIIISYGCKVPCGIFVPSMAVGACFGRMIGIVVKALHA
jgi:chloride channel 3/4/5